METELMQRKCVAIAANSFFVAKRTSRTLEGREAYYCGIPWEEAHFWGDFVICWWL